ncbi:Uncharacterised protein [Morganella morganii]|nr:Uncharacterised protein [Morganella morganii]
MSHQMTYADSRNATSSPVSGCGHSPCAAQDGRMINQSGQEVARASLSARQAKEMDLLTSGTFGQHSSTSSASANLALSLVNRLQAKTDSDGSTLFRLTWKQRTTPSARLIYALRASVRRISDSDCIGWATPTTREWKECGGCESVILPEGREDAERHAVPPVMAAHVWDGWQAVTGADKNSRMLPPDFGERTDDAAGRVGKLRAYGNAIVAPVAEEFIRAYMLITEE